ncbi:hypothetical protein [Enterobacter hormaechei]|uniref:hypothetical protein n=1 Tax=Enterobacter hormaechei TaxID=158836 RepID=UPI001B24FBA4|nr:hypothetical protein [Enterobacter hormaechei]MCU3502709.1 hypothetical protein [Enterobacter hormaechei subsp. hoffmannii]MCV5878937.1 hypothetical protein [Escherichia coli]HCI8642050.1 hypothetical protein [Enterobacter hormaechei subsp. xiangfangensis]MCO6602170.1 hypothetical protein [Enterobacter hormaechei]MCV5896469.1 hypothetical protein [Escherichia coli]
MKEQQLTENQIKAATEHVVTLLTRAKKPLKDADWLIRLPADEIARETEKLTKSLSSGWQSRIIDLYQKMQAWVEASQAEEAAIENLRTLRHHQAETEEASKDNRAQFRELLNQNGGIVTPEMKALRAEYLEQQETATELAGLITEKEEQLPVLAGATGRKAKAYANCHHGLTEERIDELLRDFFIFNGAELSSLLRMKYRQFERNSSAHIPGIIEGINDADTLYREFILNLMLKWTNEILPLRFRDDVMSLTGSAPIRLT